MRLNLLGKQWTEIKWIHQELVTDRNWKVFNKPDIQFKPPKNELKKTYVL